MKIMLRKGIDVKAKAEQVWMLVGPMFPKIELWMSFCKESSPIEGGRICIPKYMPFNLVFKEEITHIDHDNKSLRFDIVPIFGGKYYPVKISKISCRIVPLGSGSRFVWSGEFELKNWAKLLSPIIKINLSFFFDQVLKDLARVFLIEDQTSSHGMIVHSPTAVSDAACKA